MSSAYYAVFHTIIWDAVTRVLPPGTATDEDRARAARWLNHQDIKRVAAWVVGCASVTSATATPPRATGVKNGVWELFSRPVGGGRVGVVPLHLEQISSAFIELQDARHDADYDHLASFPRATAKRHVATAERAIELLEGHQDEEYLGRFLALVTFAGSRLG